MKAVHRSDVTEALEFKGATAVYPKWFRDHYIGDLIEQTPYGTDVYYSEEGEIALAEGDIFLFNSAGQIMWVDPILIETDYYLIRGEYGKAPCLLVCEKSDALECVIFEGMNGYYPDWFEDKVLDPYIKDLMGEHPRNRFAASLYLESDGTDIINPGDTFLMNKQGDVMRIDEERFESDWYIIG